MGKSYMKAVVNVRTGIFSVVCYVFISQFRAFRVSRQNKSQEFQRKNEIKFVNKKCLLVLCLQDGLNVPVSQEI